MDRPDTHSSNRVIDAFRSFSTGLLVAIISSASFGYGIALCLRLLRSWPIATWRLVIFSAILATITISLLLRNNLRLTGPLRGGVLSHFVLVSLMLLLGCLLIVMAIPAPLMIFWVLNIQCPENVFRLAIFSLGTGISIVYFLAKRDKFPAVLGKVSYFSGACLGPVAAVKVLM